LYSLVSDRKINKAMRTSIHKQLCTFYLIIIAYHIVLIHSIDITNDNDTDIVYNIQDEKVVLGDLHIMEYGSGTETGKMNSFINKKRN
jgi:hypothetical protein